MLKNSFSLEVETLTSSTKVYLKMREFGSFPSTSGLPSLRIRVHEGTTFLHTGHQRREFLLCELGEWTVALDLRRGRITSLSPRPIFALSWYSLHTYGVTASTEFIFSVGICALLSLGKISSLCVMCVCVFVCVQLFFPQCWLQLCKLQTSVVSQLILTLCPRTVGEVFFYPLLQLIICLAYATVIISPGTAEPMSFLF